MECSGQWGLGGKGLARREPGGFQKISHPARVYYYNVTLTPSL